MFVLFQLASEGLLAMWCRLHSIFWVTRFAPSVVTAATRPKTSACPANAVIAIERLSRCESHSARCREPRWFKGRMLKVRNWRRHDLQNSFKERGCDNWHLTLRGAKKGGVRFVRVICSWREDRIREYDGDGSRYCGLGSREFYMWILILEALGLNDLTVLAALKAPSWLRNRWLKLGTICHIYNPSHNCTRCGGKLTREVAAAKAPPKTVARSMIWPVGSPYQNHPAMTNFTTPLPSLSLWPINLTRTTDSHQRIPSPLFPPIPRSQPFTSLLVRMTYNIVCNLWENIQAKDQCDDL